MSVKTILEGTSGSRAYGTHDENSDFDTARVVIEPPKFVTGVEEFGTVHNKDGLDDTTVYPLKAFMSLLAKGSFNQVEVLYLPIFSVISTEGAELLKHRKLFLTKEVAGRGLGFMRGMHKKYMADKADSKDLYHFFRVWYMVRDMLKDHTVEMPLNEHYVESLMSMKNRDPYFITDSYLYNRPMSHAIEALEKSMHESTLPNSVDRDAVSQLAHRLYMMHWSTL